MKVTRIFFVLAITAALVFLGTVNRVQAKTAAKGTIKIFKDKQIVTFPADSAGIARGIYTEDGRTVRLENILKLYVTSKRTGWWEEDGRRPVAVGDFTVAKRKATVMNTANNDYCWWFAEVEGEDAPVWFNPPDWDISYDPTTMPYNITTIKKNTDGSVTYGKYRKPQYVFNAATRIVIVDFGSNRFGPVFVGDAALPTYSILSTDITRGQFNSDSSGWEGDCQAFHTLEKKGNGDYLFTLSVAEENLPEAERGFFSIQLSGERTGWLPAEDEAVNPDGFFRYIRKGGATASQDADGWVQYDLAP